MDQVMNKIIRNGEPPARIARTRTTQEQRQIDGDSCNWILQSLASTRWSEN